MNDNSSPSRLGKPVQRDIKIGLAVQQNHQHEMHILRDPLTGQDFPFRFRKTAETVARRLLVDNTAMLPRVGRPSELNPFNVKAADWVSVA